MVEVGRIVRDLETVREHLLRTGARPEVVDAFNRTFLLDTLNTDVLSRFAFYGLLRRTIENYIEGNLIIERQDRRKLNGGDRVNLRGKAKEDRRAERIEVTSDMIDVAMFDLGRFKFYNDEFGELVGDLLLAVVGGMISKNLRPYDATTAPVDYESLLRNIGSGVASREKGDEYRAMIVGTRQHKTIINRILKNVRKEAIEEAYKQVKGNPELINLFRGDSYAEKESNLEKFYRAQKTMPIVLRVGYAILKDIEKEVERTERARDPENLATRLIVASTDTQEAVKMSGDLGKVYSYQDLKNGKIGGKTTSHMPPNLVEMVQRYGGEVFHRRVLDEIRASHPDAYRLLTRRTG